MSRSLKALNRIEEQASKVFKHYKQDISYIREDLLKLKKLRETLPMMLVVANNKYYLIIESKERYLAPFHKMELSKVEYDSLKEVFG